MRRFWTKDRARRVFESRTQEWQEVGLGAELDRRSATRARRELVVVAALIIGVLVVFNHRHELFPGAGRPVRYAAAVALVLLGWAFASALARGVAPSLFRRMDPGTAGTVGFLIRLFAIVVVVIGAAAGGIEPRHPRGRRSIHRGHPRSGGAADPRQHLRRSRAADHTTVSGR